MLISCLIHSVLRFIHMLLFASSLFLLSVHPTRWRGVLSQRCLPIFMHHSITDAVKLPDLPKTTNKTENLFLHVRGMFELYLLSACGAHNMVCEPHHSTHCSSSFMLLICFLTILYHALVVASVSVCSNKTNSTTKSTLKALIKPCRCQTQHKSLKNLAG